MYKSPYTGKRDLEGVAFFVIIMTFVLGLCAVIGFLVVQDSNHQTQCVNRGYSYVNGNCLTDKTVVVDND